MEKHDEYEQEEEEFIMTDLATLAAQNKVIFILRFFLDF